MNEKGEGLVREFAIPDEAATEALGAQIAARLAPGDAVALEGDLGAGKSTLARAILHALGVSEPVPSPTFTLVQHYETATLPVDHFDLYRVKAEAELDQLGIEEALADGAVLVEWPERAESRLPTSALRVQLEIKAANSRRITISGPSRWASAFPEPTSDT